MNLNTNNIPAAIGAPIQGGFLAGQIKIGADTYALVISPKSAGQFKAKWNESDASVPGAEHYADGMSNTLALAEAGSEMAKQALSLVIAGYSDWYVPARDELEQAYRNLKPTDDANAESFRDGDNPSSVPVGYPYTADLPAQTTVDAFRQGGAEALEPAWHWTSTQYASVPSNAWGQGFGYGNQGYTHKSFAGQVRAFRRFKI